ncbi:phenylalanine--tRNA ligase subunit beta [Candidatus Saganbacteria bacterium]|nr:phenylalanine--tRNA ligase subunit beta [Candidatus Saganbacteria bacterium]
MRVPIDWLKEYVDVKIPASDLAQKLTMSGLETLSLNDSLDVDILPNRGDCSSILGIAREVSSITSSKLKMKRLKRYESEKKTSPVVSVEIREPKLCPRYMARVIENIKVKDSPDWLKKRLSTCGLRPINNIVDITNYLLLELGQPMHAFDHDKIQGQKIIVRRAAPQEKIKTLDGADFKLDKDSLVIADANRAIAVAGVMGGANTEVSAKTKTVVLESAYFDPINISKTSKSLKLRTESSARFEKTTDWNMVETALDAAASMVAELASGVVLRGQIDKKKQDIKKRRIALRFERLNAILGVPVPQGTAIKILKGLGFKLLKNSKSKIIVEVPTWRYADIEREIDLIEEIARIFGYHNIPVTSPKIGKTEITETVYSKVSNIKNILIGTGLYEVQTFSLVDPSDAEKNAIKITNPMTISESVMRTSMLPSILRVVSYNLRHQVDELGIFEVGKVFGNKVHERLVLAGSIFAPKAGFREIKGIIETLINQFSKEYTFNIIEEGLIDQWYHPVQSASLSAAGMYVAKLGLIHPVKKKTYDLNRDVYLFEVEIQALLSLKAMKDHTALSKFPKIDRDLAMFVPEGITYDQIVTSIKETAGPFLEEVKLFDQYKNSQAYRLSFRDKNSTLTDEAVNERFVAVISALEEKLGVTIRKS